MLAINFAIFSPAPSYVVLHVFPLLPDTKARPAPMIFYLFTYFLRPLSILYSSLSPLLHFSPHQPLRIGSQANALPFFPTGECRSIRQQDHPRMSTKPTGEVFIF